MRTLTNEECGDWREQRLQAVVSKAKAANMPKDKIDAAIKRGVEGKDGERHASSTAAGPSMNGSSLWRMSMLLFTGSNAESVLYEASGPAGSAFMVRLLDAHDIRRGFWLLTPLVSRFLMPRSRR